MANETEKIIEEQVKKLPKEVRDALASEDLHKNIVAIGQKHHLHIDQVGLLEDEVVLVMMGLAAPADLVGELVKQLSLQSIDAEAIAGEVSEQIFLPIRDVMKKFTEQPPSVVMPSTLSTATTSPPKAQPSSTQAVIPPKPAAPSVPIKAPAPAIKPTEIHAADLMLSEPTVSMPPKPWPKRAVVPPPASVSAPTVTAKVEAPKPAPYKADPYREPPE